MFLLPTMPLLAAIVYFITKPTRLKAVILANFLFLCLPFMYAMSVPPAAIILNRIWPDPPQPKWLSDAWNSFYTPLATLRNEHPIVREILKGYIEIWD